MQSLSDLTKMSAQRKQRYQLLIDEYSMTTCTKYDLDIPTEIIYIIFMFYSIKEFNIEYGKRIKIKANMITNICDDYYIAYKNITVTNDWMNPDSYTNHIHTIKIKITKQL